MFVHLNGNLVPAGEARVSPFDRGYLMGDGIYEGLRATNGRVIALDRHVQRMRAGLGEARIEGFDPESLDAMTDELLRANRLEEAFVYWQVTRGAPEAKPPFRTRIPPPSMRPTVFGFAAPVESVASWGEPSVKKASVRPDTRWTRGHVKSISLMGGVLAAIEAHEFGDDDAILVRDGLVTEGVSTNVFLSIGGRIVTPALESAPMLAGVTRALILDEDPDIEVRPVTEDELRRADEIMLAGTLTMVAGISTLCGKPVGDGGAPGPASRSLLAALQRAIRKDAHQHVHSKNTIHA
ncbi:MAG: aminotransferase class IV [Phycisphaerales bacterium]|nr:aminotransferase class IV [Phycisphaerales bacterium]